MAASTVPSRPAVLLFGGPCRALAAPATRLRLRVVSRSDLLANHIDPLAGHRRTDRPAANHSGPRAIRTHHLGFACSRRPYFRHT